MLKGRRIVVTGAGGTLGNAVCQRAEALGAEVVRLDVNFRSDLSVEHHIVDLTDLSATQKLFSEIGPFEGLFNIAGGFAMGASVWSENDDEWDRMFQINVTTLRNVLKSALPQLLERGSGAIVNVGAYGAKEGQESMSAYCASKSVVMRLTESLAEEVKHKGIQVNAVLPTIIDTPPNRAAMPDADPSLWVAPEDLANVICFLGSDLAQAINGAMVPVRGLS